MTEGELAFAATLPPEAAIRWFRSKGYGVSWRWQDMWHEAHLRAFTVAKATRLDVLAAIREAVDDALARGMTRREFMRELEPTLRRLGWWGRKTVPGPDGLEEVQLGSPRRLKTIFDTNMRVAENAARHRRQTDNSDSRPFWQYLSMDDDRVRPSHRALSGRVYRADDPLWQTHYPPNGWNCRCRVRALTQRQVEARGLHLTYPLVFSNLSARFR